MGPVLPVKYNRSSVPIEKAVLLADFTFKTRSEISIKTMYHVKKKSQLSITKCISIAV